MKSCGAHARYVSVAAMTFASPLASRIASRLALVTLASSTIALAVAACSADGNDADAVTSSEAGTEPEESGSVLPPSTGTDGGAIADARADAKAKDGGKDASKESGVADAGKPAPPPGSACAVIDEIFVKQCGACGKQEALCLANADGGPGGTVTEYNACTGELEGGCVPGTTDNEACGNCGTRVRTCNKYCAWTAGQCTGEPADSCSPTSNDYTTAGCPTVGTYRQRECGSTCKWSPLSSCQPLAFRLTAGANAGETTSEIYPLRALVADKRMTGTCGSNTFSTTTNHPYVYVEVANPTDKTLTMSAWNTHATNGGPSVATVMTVYPGTTKPGDEAARKTCAKTVATYCPTGLPCGYSSFAGLTGTNAFTIPPLGSVLVFFQSYYAPGGTQPSEGDVKLAVRTDAVE